MTILAMIGRILLLGLERIIVKKMGEGKGSIEVTTLFFGIGALCLLPFLFGIKVENYHFLPAALISSMIYSITFVLYVRALSEGDVSLVTPVASFNVLFLFVLSAIFLHEDVNLLKFSGIMLIFYGSSYLKPGVSLLDSLKGILQDKACLYMLLSTLLLAVGRIIDKAYSQDVSPILYSFIIYTTVSMILLLSLVVKGRLAELASLFRSRPVISTLSGAVNAFSYLFLLVALQGIEVSVAEPLTLLSTLLAVVLGRYFFQEKIKQRLIAAVIIIIGSWFLLF